MADEGKRRWADESDDEESDTEEVKSSPSTTQKIVFLSNLPFSITEADLLSALPLTDDEKPQIAFRFLQQGGRFSGSVEVTSKSQEATEKLFKFNRSSIGGRQISVTDTQIQHNSQGTRRPDRGHPARGGRPHDRRNAGQVRRPDNRQDGEGHRPHEPQGEKKPYQHDSRKPRESYRKDSGDTKPREEEVRRPIRNENPEYKVKTTTTDAPQKTEPKQDRPKTNPFGSAKPISTKVKDVEFDNKVEAQPTATEETPVETVRPKHRPYKPKQQQPAQGHEVEQTPNDQQQAADYRISTASQETKEEIKQAQKKPAWGNPDETREIFQINHKKGPSKESKPQEPEVQVDHQTEPSQQPPHFNKSRPNIRNRRRGARPSKQY